MTLIEGVTFIELRVISMEHLQRMWHAGRERLNFCYAVNIYLGGGGHNVNFKGFSSAWIERSSTQMSFANFRKS